MFEFLITTGTTIIMLIIISLIILGKKENSKFAAPLFLYFTVRSYVNVHNHNPYIFWYGIVFVVLYFICFIVLYCIFYAIYFRKCPFLNSEFFKSSSLSSSFLASHKSLKNSHNFRRLPISSIFYICGKSRERILTWTQACAVWLNWE